VRRVDILLGGAVRLDPGLYNHESNVLGVRERNVQQCGQCVELHVVDNLRVRHLRQHERYGHHGPDMLRLPERDIFLDDQFKCMCCTWIVRGRNRADGGGHRDEPAHVCGVSGRNVLPRRHHREGLMRCNQLG
jgi:hypothetical protein